MLLLRCNVYDACYSTYKIMMAAFWDSTYKFSLIYVESLAHKYMFYLNLKQNYNKHITELQPSMKYTSNTTQLLRTLPRLPLQTQVTLLKHFLPKMYPHIRFLTRIYPHRILINQDILPRTPYRALSRQSITERVTKYMRLDRSLGMLNKNQDTMTFLNTVSRYFIPSIERTDLFDLR